MTTQRWTTHSDGVDDLLAVTLPVGATGTRSPTTSLSGPAAPSNASFYDPTDHQGSVRAITDQNGAVTNAYAYDSYGTAEESVESLAQRFRYTGREFDALTGLYHYRARAYDPQTGRFLQEDPLHFEALHPKRGEQFGGEFPESKLQIGLASAFASELNLYRYVANYPVQFTDPYGKFGYGFYASAKKRALAVVGGVKSIGTAIGDLLLRRYIAADVRSGKYAN